MSDLYRKSSLDKLSSPEQLDRMIQITPPMFWISAIGGCGILLVALLWSIFARLPINVQSNGIFISKDGIQAVYSENSGIVKEVLVSRGEMVSENTVIARFDTKSIQSKIEKLEGRRTALDKVTLISAGDVASADNKDLLDIKSQILTVSSNLTQDELMLDLRKDQLKDQQVKTDTALSNMQMARNMYYGTMNTGSVTKEQIAFQQAQSDLNAAQSYYESSESNRGYFEAQNDENIDHLKDKINELKKQQDSLDRTDSEYQEKYDSLQSQIGDLDSQRDSLKDQRSYYRDNNDEKEQNLKNAESAFYNAAWAYIESEQLMLAKQTFSSQLNDNYNVALQDYNTELSRLRSLEDTVSQLSVQVSADDINLLNQYESLKARFEGTKAAGMDNLDSQIREARNELKNAEIRSSIPGYVVAMDIVVGSAVQAGNPVCTLSQTERLFELSAGAARADGEEAQEFTGSVKSENVVVCYVPISEGKRIGKGMEAMVYPSTINRQEKGHIIGRVSEVADYVTSMEDVKNRLGDSSLAQTFTGSGPVVMVTVELEEDPDTASGYKWSSKKGSSVMITPGTMVNADIVTEEKAPITMLLPLFKEKLSVRRVEAEK
ncbi:MAG: hypothetical protein K6E34_08535 [Lachnospiraceae bacterium]|nr:hypothetical protein [Lachnospiraceae bacterium]